MITLYHRTTPEAAAAILADGFRDGSGTYLTQNIHTGVWLSGVPLSAGDMFDLGDTLLKVMPPLTLDALNEYEWIEEGQPYREWLIPAAILNPLMRVEPVSEEEEDALMDDRFRKSW